MRGFAFALLSVEVAIFAVAAVVVFVEINGVAELLGYQGQSATVFAGMGLATLAFFAFAVLSCLIGTDRAARLPRVAALVLAIGLSGWALWRYAEHCSRVELGTGAHELGFFVTYPLLLLAAGAVAYAVLLAITTRRRRRRSRRYGRYARDGGDQTSTQQPTSLER